MSVKDNFSVAATLSQLRYLVFQGMKGDTGDSAYEEAVAHGFVGTEAEWIASLKGDKGDPGTPGADGHSPYLNANGVWMVWNSATGKYDWTGLFAKGRDGKSGYSPYIGRNGTWMYYDDATDEWYDSRVGPTGSKGDKGDPGTPGVSPTVTVASIKGGHRVTITGAGGSRIFDVMDGADGVSFVPAYIDYDVVRYVNAYGTHAADDIYTSIQMSEDVDNGILPFISYNRESEMIEEYFELDYQDLDATSPVEHFRSKEHLLDVDSTGHVTLMDRPQGGGSSDAVLYTEQTLTDAQKAQARNNIGSGTYSKPSTGIPKSDLASDVQTSLGKADTALQQHQSLAGYATETYVQQQIAAIPDKLPAVSASDNGKFLRVVSGAWAAATVPSAESNSFGGGS